MAKSQKRATITSARRQPGKAARQSSASRKARTKGRGSQPHQSASAPQSRPSKQAEVIALLRRPEGVTVAEVVAATGWQPHTVRGLFSGTLKKKLGLALGSSREERGRIYRIGGAGGLQATDAGGLQTTDPATAPRLASGKR
jgi:hypothetical protein